MKPRRILSPRSPSFWGNPSIATLIALSFAAGHLASAADDIWLNPPVTTNWADASNWVGGAAPGATGTTTNPDTATFGVSTGLGVTVDAGRNLRNLVFAANNSYTLGGGSLLLTSGGSIFANGSSSGQTIAATTSLQIQGDGGTYSIKADMPGTSRLLAMAAPISGVSTAGNVTSLTLEGASGGANLISGGISDGTGGGRLAVIKDGAGLWVYNGANAYTGGTTVNGGTLRLSGSGNTSVLIGAGTLTLNGGTLRLQSTASTTVNNDVVIGAAGGFVSVRTNDGFNPASLTGTGTLTLTGDNGLLVTSTNFRGFAGTVRVVAGTGFTVRLGTGYVDNSLGNAVLQLESNTTLSRQTGTNSTITTTIGTLAGATGSTLGASAAGSGTFIYSVGGRNEDSVFSGAVVDGGTKTGLTKTGAGKLTLDGVNTYTGATTVSGGTLLVNGSLGATAVNVTAGTLGGTGTISGAVTVGSGAFVSPAASIGVQSLASVVLNGTLITEYDGAGAGLIDRLQVAGLLDIANATVDFNQLGAGLDDGSYVFASYGSLAGTQFANVLDLPAGYQIDYAYNNGITSNNLALVTIPEPSAALLGALGLLALARRKRDR